ncbi:MAG: Uma2 family endonuclease, partial [Oscillatoriales cyanobacterium]
GLGLWHGDYLGVDRLWLRWYDSEGNWIPTPEERAEQAQERADEAQERADEAQERAEIAETRLQSLIERLRESGIDPDQFLNG